MIRQTMILMLGFSLVLIGCVGPKLMSNSSGKHASLCLFQQNERWPYYQSQVPEPMSQLTSKRPGHILLMCWQKN